MKGKKCVLILTLTFLLGAIMAPLPPVKSNSYETRLSIRESPPPDGYMPGKVVGADVDFTVDIESPSAWDNTSNGIVGYYFDVTVDPDVLEPVGLDGAKAGYWLYEFCMGQWYFSNFPELLNDPPNNETGEILNIVEALLGYGPLGLGAGGNSTYYFLPIPAPGTWKSLDGAITLQFKSKSRSAYTKIDISDAHWIDVNGTDHAFDVVDDGHYNPPFLYLHYDSGLIDLTTSPAVTDWHELYPTYSNNYNITDWYDADSDSNFSSSDKIELKDDEWYDVRNITVTIHTKYGEEKNSTNSPSTTFGDWWNGTFAYADGSGNASQRNVTIGAPSASQYYGGYGFNIPSDSTIVEVRVRLDAWTEPGYLWIADGSDWIYKVTTLDLTTAIESWDYGTSYPNGIEYYDGYVYWVDSGTELLYKVFENGTLVQSWDTSGFSAAAFGLGVNGTHFAIADKTSDDVFFTLVGAPGTQVQTFPCDADTEGITWKAGYWYATSSNTDAVNKYHPSNGTVAATYNLHSDIGSSTGITWDGTYWWISDDGDNVVYKLTQSDLEGGTYTSSNDTVGSDEQGLCIVRGGDEKLYLKVSADGGATWLAAGWNKTLTGTEATYWANVTDWTGWTPAKINSNKIRTQVWSHSQDLQNKTVYLDWIPIELTYIEYSYMYVEFEGDIQDFTWAIPENTDWHEVYPVFSNIYDLTDWTDDDSSGNLTINDDVQLNSTWYLVDDMDTDIILIGPVEAPVVVPEFPLGVALEVGLIVAIAYVWWRGRRKTKKPSRRNWLTDTISKPATTIC